MQPSHTNFAVTNFSNSGASGLYDRARPDYPSAALQPIFECIKQGPSNDGRCKVLELGSGTGIFTRCFLQADSEHIIQEVLAVEPSSGMREGFVKALQKIELAGRKVETVDGLFHRIPADDASYDIMVVAQAWHWCVGADHEKSLREMRRVLKKGGHLVLIWNLEDRESASWVAQIRDVYESYEKGVPQYRTGEWKKMFELESYSSLFGPASEVHHSRTIETTRQGVKDRVASKSYITALDDGEREKVMRGVDAILDRGEGISWINREEGTFHYPYKTDVYIMKSHEGAVTRSVVILSNMPSSPATTTLNAILLPVETSHWLAWT
ncbi:hypothetical protein PROFUN_01010 [Planoprotostelium fungivorum]|uniref:Methyltransferase type 11 domain-containing protein n=1 Tax=Planoprotostelium fungivorum TaxID=1890364 RepID=A0A2P6N4G4_9EUKA|nr:hypothetical protein PROFUN_01010 [Planoprotostelium fungivorum]